MWYIEVYRGAAGRAGERKPTALGRRCLGRTRSLTKGKHGNFIRAHFSCCGKPGYAFVPLLPPAPTAILPQRLCPTRRAKAGQGSALWRRRFRFYAFACGNHPSFSRLSGAGGSAQCLRGLSAIFRPGCVFSYGLCHKLLPRAFLANVQYGTWAFGPSRGGRPLPGGSSHQCVRLPALCELLC